MALLQTFFPMRRSLVQRPPALCTMLSLSIAVTVISSMAPATVFAAAPAPATSITAPPQALPPVMSDGWQFIQTDGAALYRASCQGCHMPQGQGAHGAGLYPAVAKNPRISAASYVAYTVLKGRKGMPGFAWSMSDAQVAEVVNFVRGNFGNEYAEPISAAEVSKLR